VTGCLSQRYSDDLFTEMPEVDIFLGVNDYPNLPAIIQGHQKGKRNQFKSTYDRQYIEISERKQLSAPYTAYLKIAEGCDNSCAYCVIPSIRGPYRSRNKEAILNEAKDLANHGCRELTLIAQDVTGYGLDLYQDYALPSLLEDLCLIENLKWIRLMYCYEDRITEDLITVMARQDKICKYLDIPIQHCSDKLLKLMNRRSTKDSIIDKIERLRQVMPDIHIRTTIITGFPGETQLEFKELMAFIAEMKFDRLGVFAYSKEEDTPASVMKAQVRELTKAKRRDDMMALQRQISFALNQKKIGRTFEVLIEEVDEEEHTCTGRTCYDAREIDNEVLFTPAIAHIIGDFATVRITDAFDYDLTGEEIVQ
jgi:ribosomal protein S12 methylthiotransferase